MKAHAIKLNKLGNPMVFWALLAGIFLFAGLYVCLIQKTVWNVVARQKAESNLASLSSKTGQLESTYMSMKGNIDLNLAHSLGFNTNSNTKYINRTTLGQIPSRTVE